MTGENSSSAIGPSETDDVFEKIGSSDQSTLDASLAYIKELFSREEDRKKSTESKASTLLGFSGLTSSLILSSSKLLFDLRLILPFSSLVGLVLIYTTAVIALGCTVGYSLMSLRVKVYCDVHPDNVCGFQSDTIVNIKRRWIASLLVALRRNFRQTNEKVTELNKAQIAFAFAIVLLLFLAVLLSVSLFFPIRDC